MPTLNLPLTDTPSLLGGFDETLLESARKGEHALLQAKRTAAYDSYAQIPNPDRFHEEYRRMDPDLFKIATFSPLEIPETAAAYQAVPEDSNYDVVISVSSEGIAIEDCNGVLTDGSLVVMPLDQAAREHTTLLEQSLGAAMVPGEQRKFLDLNGAFWNVGFFIYAKKGVDLKGGILIRYHNDQAGTVLLPRLVVVAESLTRFAIAEQFTSPDDVKTLCISGRELLLDAAADVKLVSLQDWGNEGLHIGEDWARVKRDAKVNLFSMTVGGKVSKMTVGCDVCEPNANAYLGGMFFADRDQHFDQKTLQYHSSADTYSNMLYKGAVKDNGYSVYQGIIRALKNCVGVDSYQTNNNLVLDSTARADSLPGLIIDADELACSHGATFGNIDQEQLYYLRSRGIPEGEARRMLVMGFFDEVIERIPFENMQDHLHAVIERKFGV
ncbi:Fe-S cluster assembly protein SufD [Kiritimatiellota bacterium B12222]|nr:Fe-S cluster assembly protein SufD [Kiritimatiellota bacterium B12222]